MLYEVITFEEALLRRFPRQFALDAAHEAPERLSARAGLAGWQTLCLWTALIGAGAAILFAPSAALSVAGWIV